MMPDTLIFILTLPGKPGKGMAEALDFLGGPLQGPFLRIARRRRVLLNGSVAGLGELSQPLCARKDSPG